MSYQKFGNKPTIVNGIKFQSRLEAERFQQLRLLEQAGEISGLMLQVEFQILRGWTNPGIISEYGMDEDGDILYHTTETPTKAGERIKSRFYVADFVYFDTRTKMWVIEDTKGMETADFRLKWDYMRSQYPQYEFRKVRREDI